MVGKSELGRNRMGERGGDKGENELYQTYKGDDDLRMRGK